MTNTTPEQLKNLALQVYKECGYVDVIRLSNELGIDVLATESRNGFSAHIAYEEETGKYSILVNVLDEITRQRFSIAHELSHYVLHRNKINEDKYLHRGIKKTSNRDVEKEADRLAGEILMPEELVDEYMQSQNLTKGNSMPSYAIKEFADYFKVSATAATIRLRELGYMVSLTYVV